MRKHAAAAGATPSSSAVRSTLAPLTAAPGTLVESVALVLRRLQNGDVPEDSEKSGRERLNKVGVDVSSRCQDRLQASPFVLIPIVF